MFTPQSEFAGSADGHVDVRPMITRPDPSAPLPARGIDDARTKTCLADVPRRARARGCPAARPLLARSYFLAKEIDRSRLPRDALLKIEFERSSFARRGRATVDTGPDE
jgi:hypothetical protein